jgi:hypothetical protein
MIENNDNMGVSWVVNKPPKYMQGASRVLVDCPAHILGGYLVPVNHPAYILGRGIEADKLTKHISTPNKVEF